MRLKPRGRIVLLKRETEESIRGIVIPGQAQKFRIIVKAVGPRVKDIEVGMEVEINPRGGAVIVGEREDMVLCDERDILAIVER